MKLIIQYVTAATVKVNNQIVGKINTGYCVLVGFAATDTPETVDSLCQKLINVRIIPDKEGKLNLSLLQSGAEVMVVPNFTLLGALPKGLRPDYHLAANPELAQKLFDLFLQKLKNEVGESKVTAGVFGAHMKLTLEADGPVTYILED
jgi:D-aminoacyl-tRNA deacylase